MIQYKKDGREKHFDRFCASELCVEPDLHWWMEEEFIRMFKNPRFHLLFHGSPSGSWLENSIGWTLISRFQICKWRMETLRVLLTFSVIALFKRPCDQSQRTSSMVLIISVMVTSKRKERLGLAIFKKPETHHCERSLSAVCVLLLQYYLPWSVTALKVPQTDENYNFNRSLLWTPTERVYKLKFLEIRWGKKTTESFDGSRKAHAAVSNPRLQSQKMLSTRRVFSAFIFREVFMACS